MDNNKIKEKNKYIIDKYNKDVENTGGKYLYNNGSAAEKYVKQRVLNNMMSIYDFSNKTLLELGCGDETFSLDFALLNPTTQILATEPVAGAIQAAKEKKIEMDIKNIEFETLSVYDINFDTKFDCALFSGVIHHLPDPEKAINIVSNYADNIIIIEPNGYAPVLKLLEKYSKYHIEHEEKSYTLSTLKKWFNNAGMKVTYSKFIDIVPVFCPDFAAHILNFFTPAFETLPIIKKLACARVIMLATKI